MSSIEKTVISGVLRNAKSTPVKINSSPMARRRSRSFSNLAPFIKSSAAMLLLMALLAKSILVEPPKVTSMGTNSGWISKSKELIFLTTGSIIKLPNISLAESSFEAIYFSAGYIGFKVI